MTTVDTQKSVPLRSFSLSDLENGIFRPMWIIDCRAYAELFSFTNSSMGMLECWREPNKCNCHSKNWQDTCLPSPPRSAFGSLQLMTKQMKLLSLSVKVLSQALRSPPRHLPGLHLKLTLERMHSVIFEHNITFPTGAVIDSEVYSSDWSRWEYASSLSRSTARLLLKARSAFSSPLPMPF